MTLIIPDRGAILAYAPVRLDRLAAGLERQTRSARRLGRHARGGSKSHKGGEGAGV